MFPATPLRQVRRGMALFVLGAVAVAIAVLVLVSFSARPPVGAVDEKNGDLALYGRVVDRLQQGQDYYPALHAELASSGYPTASVFNWRTPLLLTLVARAPSVALAQGGLAALAVAASALGLVLLRRRGGLLLAGIAAPLMILCYGAAVAPGTVYFGEVVGGFLILASAACYGLGRHLPGIVLALLALFVRELAAPYVLVCCAFALLQGRRGEMRLALTGLAAFAVYYGLHVHAVLALLGPNELADPESWLHFGGLSFVLQSAAFNGVLLLAPLWVTAIILPLGLLGLFAFTGGARMAAAVVTYALLFLALGKPFNDYWGALYTPLLALGLVWAPLALRDLLLAVRTGSVPAPAASHSAHGL